MNIQEKYHPYLIFILSLSVLIGLQLASINPSAQDRFFDFSQEMLKRGPSFFPYVQGKPYPDYIALVMILSHTITNIFGHVSLFSVGLPYCMAGALIVTFTYLLGALQSTRLGLMGAFFCLLSWKFLDAMSSLDLDLFPALATIICIYLAHKNALSSDSPPYLEFFLLWLFAFFCRGPIGLLVPAMITGLYYFADRNWKISFFLAVSAIWLFILTWLLLLLMAYKTGGTDFLRSVLEQEGIGRVVNEHAPRYYFFFTIGILDYAFTSLFAILVGMRFLGSIISKRALQSKRKLLIFALQWMLVLILIFTIPATKKARYIMACVPAFALLSAYAFELKELTLFKIIINTILKAMPLLGGIIAISCLSLPHITTAAYYLLLISMACFVCQLLFARSRYHTVSIYLIALIQMFAIHLTIIEPITLQSLSRATTIPLF